MDFLVQMYLDKCHMWSLTCKENVGPDEFKITLSYNEGVESTGLSGLAKSVKRFERSNGLDTALYKN